MRYRQPGSTYDEKRRGRHAARGRRRARPPQINGPAGHCAPTAADGAREAGPKSGSAARVHAAPRVKRGVRATFCAACRPRRLPDHQGNRRAQRCVRPGQSTRPAAARTSMIRPAPGGANTLTGGLAYVGRADGQRPGRGRPQRGDDAMGLDADRAGDYGGVRWRRPRCRAHCQAALALPVLAADRVAEGPGGALWGPGRPPCRLAQWTSGGGRGGTGPEAAAPVAAA
jgi:hypothetical protein